MNKLRTARLLMAATILLIITFQGYWLRKLFVEEKSNFKKSTDLIFRESMYRLQTNRFKGDTMFFRGMPEDNLFMSDLVTTVNKISIGKNDSLKTELSISMKSGTGTHDSLAKVRNDTMIYIDRKGDGIPPPELARFLEHNKTLNDSIPLNRIDSMYSLLLAKEGINVSYHIIKTNALPKTPGENGKTRMVTIKLSNENSKTFSTKKVPVGFLSTTFYSAEFGDVTWYIVKKIGLQFVLSLLLVALTLLSFVFIYRNLLAQKRLTEIKNEFIGNITHELKTPIATVSVAIEAMKNFDALQNPERTKEYLGIAGQELNRLSLLVDKVLRLSMFETQQVELKYEWFDIQELVQEVIGSMNLQFEKSSAAVSVNFLGTDFLLMADRMHITSVIYNLLDNALKYSKGKPEIDVKVEAGYNEIVLQIKDKGIGIPASYKEKVFDKFFRVPHGDKHNVKGYGLGLSYVAHIIAEHKGTVNIESEEGRGATFIIKLPKGNAAN